MKLASLKDADPARGRDGRLVVVSNDLAWYADATHIAPTLQALPPRDRIVLHLRFVEDLTQAEIAERVGVSQMHVSRLIRRALERLRTVADHSG